MALDPSIIAAMNAAVDADPENVPLRVHLAKLLQDSGDPAGALEQYARVLEKQPDHLDALTAAANAADAMGDKIRAHGYRRLYEGLSWDRAKNLIDNAENLPEDAPLDTDKPRRIQETAQGMPPEPVKLRMTGDDASEDRWEAEKSELTLADVAGLEEVKRRLNMAFLAPLKNPDMRKLYGKSLRGGLLLYGPPGCGKTYIARATAGELGARFISVGMTDVIDMWLGQSEKNLHEIFEAARRNKPCVLFFDEIDALGRKRSLMRESAGRGIVNQLLAELDSVGQDNDGVFILAATNHPWDVDTALRRPGRLDRTLLVLPPDTPAREAVLRFHSRERPLDTIDFAWLAAKSEDYSGADLAHVCESAAEFAMEDSLRTGTARPITTTDFKKALKEIRPSVRPWFDTARNYALFANEGGVYDDLLKYLRDRRMM